MRQASWLQPGILKIIWQIQRNGAGAGAVASVAAAAGAPPAHQPPRAPAGTLPAGMALCTAAVAPGGGVEAVKTKQAVRKDIIRALKALSPEAMAAQSESREGGHCQGSGSLPPCAACTPSPRRLPGHAHHARAPPPP
jgi:hypothetical protein